MFFRMGIAVKVAKPHTTSSAPGLMNSLFKCLAKTCKQKWSVIALCCGRFRWNYQMIDAENIDFDHLPWFGLFCAISPNFLRFLRKQYPNAIQHLSKLSQNWQTLFEHGASSSSNPVWVVSMIVSAKICVFAHEHGSESSQTPHYY